MTSSPNYQKLYEIGKLPVEMRSRVGLLAEADKATEHVEELRKGMCDECRDRLFPGAFTVVCEIPGCADKFSGSSDARAKNYLRLHMRKHETGMKSV